MRRTSSKERQHTRHTQHRRQQEQHELLYQESRSREPEPKEPCEVRMARYS